MNRTPVPVLAVVMTLALIGCKSPQQSTAPSTHSDTTARQDEGYNRGYETEARHHHRHHGRGDGQTSSDHDRYNDEQYNNDRSDRDEGAATAATQDARNTGADDLQPRSARHHNRRARTATPGQFDYYVLNLSWSPEFCHSHSTAAECAQHRAFTLHGLWPENNDGTYPEDCSEAAGPANPSQYADIYPDPSLLQHEWQTHGTCSGLAPDPFFTSARRAEQSIQIPAQLAHLTQQLTLTSNQIVTLFTQTNPGLTAADVALTCGSNYLTAVEVCIDKNLKPQSCTALKTCGATSVRILPPQ